MRVSRAEFRRMTGQKAPKVPRTHGLAQRSDLEEKFAWHMIHQHNTLLERQVKFHPTRNWRFDFACSRLKIAVELVGLFSQDDGGASRHRRIGGMKKDYEKHNAATELGWHIFYATRDMIPTVAATVARLCAAL